MEKAKKKRGRPAIKPHIKALIVSRVLGEQAKSPELRMPRKLLAYEIHKEISQAGEQSPEVSTLEKLISAYISASTNKPNRQDEPWSLYSYYYYEVPPEALPTVLNVWLSARRDDRLPITNREIKWVIRLYKVIPDIDKLKLKATELAFTELIGDIAGTAMLAHPRRPLTLIEAMTGREFSEHEANDIALVSLPEDYHQKIASRHVDSIKEFMAELEGGKK